MSDNYLLSVLSITVLSFLGSLGFQRVYSGDNWLLRHSTVLIGVLLVLFGATFSAINGYGLDKLPETYFGKPIAKLLGFEVFSGSPTADVSEPEIQPWLYQSGLVGGAFATQIDGRRAVFVLNCEARSPTPYLSLSLYLPDFIENQTNIIAGLDAEFRKRCAGPTLTA
ncbi:hypothetical protein [Sulfitobacter geojensis]|uniref:Uncharacterized protein n=1 Tax=Sulfitobacter geojensis TaxID=1342299 RepID=A0AAE2W184_9RHOB|nr:hypothetical protein [Sulfitobacter geojensis]MBM1690693.1 hypothetical protein [Sulfitobacter geojensis]MBM1694759.1 hypothetical protein [Sulfitobacter geojensis]MBM1707535.1 hypothetical protein [Sulfitobacter geojensis]MBM1711145.1 hypothetical protein [Sulfitobacter geojensis]MBM1715660.1 hypothetical protein [Sulfitobacter geojensis]